MDYETNEMTTAQAAAFEKWYDNEIGTDLEKNEVDEGVFYFLCLELETKAELLKVRNMDNFISRV